MTRAPSLGPRGEGWVAGQAVLGLGIAGAGVLGPAWPEAWRVLLWLAAAAVAVASLPLVLGGLLHLGSQLTPFPRPVDHGEVKEGAAYRWVRHPIYGGVLLLAVAWSAGTSPLALALTAILGLLFEGKRRREEAWLEERHPEYADYRRRVRWRFVPLVW